MAAIFLIGLTVTALYNVIDPDGVLVLDRRAMAFWRCVVSYHPLMRLPEFLAGMACGVLFLRRGSDRRWAWPLILAGIGLIAIVAAVLHRHPFMLLHAPAVAPLFAAIVYGVALRPAGLGFLERKFFLLLGDASYSFYLLHTMVLSAYGRFFLDAAGNLRRQNALWFLLPIATIALISILVYKFIEKPMRRVLRPKRTKAGEENSATLPRAVPPADLVS